MKEHEISIERPGEKLIQRASQYSTATLHEALDKRGDLPVAIKPIANEFRVCGSATTVSSPPGDNLMLHQAIYIAQPGDILVVEVSGYYDAGYWGDIMTHAAMQRGIKGLIIDGCVRDSDDIKNMNFPVFSRGLCIHGTTKHGGFSINQPIMIGKVTINPGDLVVGDADGVVVIPQKELMEVLNKAEDRERKEDLIRKELSAGKSSLEIYGWSHYD
jgi:4-hydroxy-4-methyl-2-oxoglutarate aldolase